jgi:hypothetical protein
MSLIVVSELDYHNSKHIRWIRFPLDAGKKFCYRSRGSINAFAYGTKHYNYKPNIANPDYLYHFSDWDTKLADIEIAKECLGRNIYENIPIVDVGSIWEFYNLIRWDWKKKKWTF